MILRGDNKKGGELDLSRLDQILVLVETLQHRVERGEIIQKNEMI